MRAGTFSFASLAVWGMPAFLFRVWGFKGLGFAPNILKPPGLAHQHVVFSLFYARPSLSHLVSWSSLQMFFFSSLSPAPRAVTQSEAWRVNFSVLSKDSD